MRSLYYWLLALCWPLVGLAQVPTIDHLPPLRKTALVHRYVNFEVLKVMAGQGLGSATVRDTDGRHVAGDFAWSHRFQILVPYSLWRDGFPVVYGATFGRSRLAWNNVELRETQGNHLEFVSGSGNRRSSVRTGFVGVTVLKYFRFERFPFHRTSCTVLAGPSAEVNLMTRVAASTKETTRYWRGNKYVHPLAFPFQLQAAISWNQFVSVGLFGTYDLSPRFRSSAGLGHTRQCTAGLSVGLII